MSRIARAQSYPTRLVHIIVGFLTGGSTDIVARLMGQWLSERLAWRSVSYFRPRSTRCGVVYGLTQETLVSHDALDRLCDLAQPSCPLSMFGFEIADSRGRNRVERLQLRDDNVLLWVMARIRIVLEIIDDGEDDLVIRAIAAIEYTQLPFQDMKQLFDIAMFLTQNLDDLYQFDLPRVRLTGSDLSRWYAGIQCVLRHCARSSRPHFSSYPAAAL